MKTSSSISNNGTGAAALQPIQECYNQYVNEHGCKGKGCYDCHCAFDHNKETGEFRCIIVELATAAGVKET